MTWGDLCTARNWENGTNAHCLKLLNHKGKHRFEGRKTRAELKEKIRALTDQVEDLEQQVALVSKRSSACMAEFEALALDVQAARLRVIAGTSQKATLKGGDQ